MVEREEIEYAEENSPEVLYGKAITVMEQANTEVAYRAAAKMFTMAGDYRDAKELALSCLEKAEISRKDALYSSARELMETNTVSGFESAINILRQITGWKDADDLIPVCRKGSEEAKARNEEMLRREKEERKACEKKRWRAIRTVIIAAVGLVLICAALVVLQFTVIAPQRKYNDAMDLYNDGQYGRAKRAFLELNGFGDSEKMVAACDEAICEPLWTAANSFYNNKEYAEAFAICQDLGGYKNSEELALKCRAELLKIAAAKQLDDVANAEVGSFVRFGLYEQYSRYTLDEIVWLVLAKENGKALLISKNALDCQVFDSDRSEAAWESSHMRAWLNGDFYNSAFGDGHKELISRTTVTADPNPESEISPGNDTEDNVFLLSVPEVRRYFGANTDRRCVPTYYADANGAWTSTEFLIDGRVTCWWWLRSPGGRSNFAARVRSDGSVDCEGSLVYGVFNAVRPAVWIDLGGAK